MSLKSHVKKLNTKSPDDLFLGLYCGRCVREQQGKAVKLETPVSIAKRTRAEDGALRWILLDSNDRPRFDYKIECPRCHQRVAFPSDSTLLVALEKIVLEKLTTVQIEHLHKVGGSVTQEDVDAYEGRRKLEKAHSLFSTIADMQLGDTPSL